MLYICISNTVKASIQRTYLFSIDILRSKNKLLFKRSSLRTGDVNRKRITIKSALALQKTEAVILYAVTISAPKNKMLMSYNL